MKTTKAAARTTGSTKAEAAAGRDAARPPRASGTRPFPVEATPPFPHQHQRSPGLQRELDPVPAYRAPLYRAAGKLEGKCALITGGDSGIGRAVALLYVREGAKVALSYLPAEQPDAEDTLREIEALGGTCVLLPGDLTASGYCDRLVDAAAAALGGIDLLVSNAAHQSRKASLDEVTDDELHLTFRTNFYAYFQLARACLRHMKPGSAIVVTSSETGIKGAKRLPDYSASKGAINAFTKTLAMDLIPRQIRVNAVAPGPVWTPLNPSDRGLTAAEVAEFGRDSPMGRPAQPEELAPAYVFLASNADSSYITGTVLQVMGGETTGG